MLWPQWLRTLLVTLLLLGFTPFWVQVVATFEVYGSARSAYVGMIVSGALAVHLWPPQTSPWRTVALAAVLSAVVGMFGLLAGMDRYALVAATVVGFGVIALRVNSWGRTLVEMLRVWRVVR